MLFLLLYFSSFMIVISFNDFMLVWLSLEINMISFIMLMYNKYSEVNVESCLKYFFVQALGSVFFFMFFYMNVNLFSMMGCSILCYKMAGGPFYFWFPSVCLGIGWGSCYLLMTFQSILPLLFISLMYSDVIWFFAFVSLIMGMLGSMNESMLKKLMAYSSIHHIGWMFVCIMVKDLLWILYLFLYSLMMLAVFMFLMNMNVESVLKLMDSKNKILLLMGMLGMGGVPPFLGFFLKWWGLYYIMKYDYSLMLIMIVFSVIMLYIYFRVIYDIILGGSIHTGWEINGYNMVNLYWDMIGIYGIILGSFFSLFFIL